MKRIGIIGATGMLGRPVTKALIEAGYELRLLVREPEKARAFFGRAVTYAQGDLRDPSSITGFLQGLEGLYINLSVAQNSRDRDYQPEREGLDAILAAARNSQLQRIAYLSSLVHFYQGKNGFNWWAFTIKQQAVEKIKTCGIPYTIFYPSTFMESFSEGAYRQGNFIALAGESRFKMYLVAGADYGKQVARVFTMNKSNHEYVVQGTEGFTADEAARFFVTHYKKKKIRVMKAPLEMLKFLGRFSAKMNYGAHVIEALNNYPEKLESAGTWEELGKPSLTFERYVNLLNS